MDVTTCPSCGTPGPEPFLTRTGVPIRQNTPEASEAAARAVPRGDLELVHCRACAFVWNAAFDPNAALYGERYENDQSLSPTFAEHMRSLVGRIADAAGGGHVVEVGCGNGTFLRQLIAETDCSATGYDPSYRGPLEEAGGRLRFVPAYFGGAEVADLVVCRHVIEHVPEPIPFLTGLAGVLAPGARCVFETPSLEWILDGVVHQDLFYEHCSYWTEASLVAALDQAGFGATTVSRVFGEQYLWVECGVGAGGAAPPPAADLGPRLARYRRLELARLDAVSRHLEELCSAGAVAVWGAGAKGVTFANLLDPGRAAIDCVIDLNPAKQGGFLPGTGHPIVDLPTAVARGVTSAIVMNPNYFEECVDLARPYPGLRLEMEQAA